MVRRHAVMLTVIVELLLLGACSGGSTPPPTAIRDSGTPVAGAPELRPLTAEQPEGVRVCESSGSSPTAC